MATEILLVTDQPDIGRFWSFALMQRGLGCAVSAPEELLSDPPSQPWDAAIIDLYAADALPVEVCEALCQRVGNPVLLLWDAYDEASILRAYETGAAEVLQRPVSPLLLAAKLQAWLCRVRPSAPATAPAATTPVGRTAGSGR